MTNFGIQTDETTDKVFNLQDRSFVTRAEKRKRMDDRMYGSAAEHYTRAVQNRNVIEANIRARKGLDEKADLSADQDYLDLKTMDSMLQRFFTLSSYEWKDTAADILQEFAKNGKVDDYRDKAYLTNILGGLGDKEWQFARFLMRQITTDGTVEGRVDPSLLRNLTDRIDENAEVIDEAFKRYNNQIETGDIRHSTDVEYDPNGMGYINKAAFVKKFADVGQIGEKTVRDYTTGKVRRYTVEDIKRQSEWGMQDILTRTRDQIDARKAVHDANVAKDAGNFEKEFGISYEEFIDYLREKTGMGLADSITPGMAAIIARTMSFNFRKGTDEEKRINRNATLRGIMSGQGNLPSFGGLSAITGAYDFGIQLASGGKQSVVTQVSQYSPRKFQVTIQSFDGKTYNRMLFLDKEWTDDKNCPKKDIIKAFGGPTKIKFDDAIEKQEGFYHPLDRDNYSGSDEDESIDDIAASHEAYISGRDSKYGGSSPTAIRIPMGGIGGPTTLNLGTVGTDVHEILDILKNRYGTSNQSTARSGGSSSSTSETLTMSQSDIPISNELRTILNESLSVPSFNIPQSPIEGSSTSQTTSPIEATPLIPTPMLGSHLDRMSEMIPWLNDLNVANIEELAPSPLSTYGVPESKPGIFRRIADRFRSSNSSEPSNKSEKKGLLSRILNIFRRKKTDNQTQVPDAVYSDNDLFADPELMFADTSDIVPISAPSSTSSAPTVDERISNLKRIKDSLISLFSRSKEDTNSEETKDTSQGPSVKSEKSDHELKLIEWQGEPESLFHSDFRIFANKAINAIMNLPGGIRLGLPSLEGVKDLAKRAGSAIGSTVKTVGKTGLEALSLLGSGAVNGLGLLGSGALSLGKWGLDKAGGLLSGAWNLTKGAAGAIGSGLKGAWDWAKSGALGSMAKTGWDWTKNAAGFVGSNAWKAVKGTAGFAWNRGVDAKRWLFGSDGMEDMPEGATVDANGVWHDKDGNVIEGPKAKKGALRRGWDWAKEMKDKYLHMPSKLKDWKATLFGGKDSEGNVHQSIFTRAKNKLMNWFGFGDGPDYVDIYRKDDAELGHCLLKESQQRAGVFYADGSGKVEHSRDIDKPVVDEKNNTLISQDDINAGLVDKDGNSIYEKRKNIFQKIKSGISKWAGKATDFIGSMFDSLLPDKGADRYFEEEPTFLGKRLGFTPNGLFQDRVVYYLDSMARQMGVDVSIDVSNALKRLHAGPSTCKGIVSRITDKVTSWFGSKKVDYDSLAKGDNPQKVRKALEDAGYTINDDGTVVDKDGRTVDRKDIENVLRNIDKKPDNPDVSLEEMSAQVDIKSSEQDKKEAARAAATPFQARLLSILENIEKRLGGIEDTGQQSVEELKKSNEEPDINGTVDEDGSYADQMRDFEEATAARKAKYNKDNNKGGSDDAAIKALLKNMAGGDGESGSGEGKSGGGWGSKIASALALSWVATKLVGPLSKLANTGFGKYIPGLSKLADKTAIKAIPGLTKLAGNTAEGAAYLGDAGNIAAMQANATKDTLAAAKAATDATEKSKMAKNAADMLRLSRLNLGKAALDTGVRAKQFGFISGGGRTAFNSMSMAQKIKNLGLAFKETGQGLKTAVSAAKNAKGFVGGAKALGHGLKDTASSSRMVLDVSPLTAILTLAEQGYDAWQGSKAMGNSLDSGDTQYIDRELAKRKFKNQGWLSRLGRVGMAIGSGGLSEVGGLSQQAILDGIALKMENDANDINRDNVVYGENKFEGISRRKLSRGEKDTLDDILSAINKDSIGVDKGYHDFRWNPFRWFTESRGDDIKKQKEETAARITSDVTNTVTHINKCKYLDIPGVKEYLLERIKLLIPDMLKNDASKETGRATGMLQAIRQLAKSRSAEEFLAYIRYAYNLSDDKKYFYNSWLKELFSNIKVSYDEFEAHIKKCIEEEHKAATQSQSGSNPASEVAAAVDKSMPSGADASGSGINPPDKRDAKSSIKLGKSKSKSDDEFSISFDGKATKKELDDIARKVDYDWDKFIDEVYALACKRSRITQPEKAAVRMYMNRYLVDLMGYKDPQSIDVDNDEIRVNGILISEGVSIPEIFKMFKSSEGVSEQQQGSQQQRTSGSRASAAADATGSPSTGSDSDINPPDKSSPSEKPGGDGSNAKYAFKLAPDVIMTKEELDAIAKETGYDWGGFQYKVKKVVRRRTKNSRWGDRSVGLALLWYLAFLMGYKRPKRVEQIRSGLFVDGKLVNNDCSISEILNKYGNPNYKTEEENKQKQLESASTETSENGLDDSGVPSNNATTSDSVHEAQTDINPPDKPKQSGSSDQSGKYHKDHVVIRNISFSYKKLDEMAKSLDYDWDRLVQEVTRIVDSKRRFDFIKPMGWQDVERKLMKYLFHVLGYDDLTGCTYGRDKYGKLRVYVAGKDIAPGVLVDDLFKQHSEGGKSSSQKSNDEPSLPQDNSISPPDEVKQETTKLDANSTSVTADEGAKLVTDLGDMGYFKYRKDRTESLDSESDKDVVFHIAYDVVISKPEMDKLVVGYGCSLHSIDAALYQLAKAHTKDKNLQEHNTWEHGLWFYMAYLLGYKNAKSVKMTNTPSCQFIIDGKNVYTSNKQFSVWIYEVLCLAYNGKSASSLTSTASADTQKEDASISPPDKPKVDQPKIEAPKAVTAADAGKAEEESKTSTGGSSSNAQSKSPVFYIAMDLTMTKDELDKLVIDCKHSYYDICQKLHDIIQNKSKDKYALNHLDNPGFGLYLAYLLGYKNVKRIKWSYDYSHGVDVSLYADGKKINPPPDAMYGWVSNVLREYVKGNTIQPQEDASISPPDKPKVDQPKIEAPKAVTAADAGKVDSKSDADDSSSVSSGINPPDKSKSNGSSGKASTDTKTFKYNGYTVTESEINKMCKSLYGNVSDDEDEIEHAIFCILHKKHPTVSLTALDDAASELVAKVMKDKEDQVRQFEQQLSLHSSKRDAVKEARDLATKSVETSASYKPDGSLRGITTGTKTSVVPNAQAGDDVYHSHVDGSPTSIKDVSTAIASGLRSINTIRPKSAKGYQDDLSLSSGYADNNYVTLKKTDIGPAIMESVKFNSSSKQSGSKSDMSLHSMFDDLIKSTKSVGKGIQNVGSTGESTTEILKAIYSKMDILIRALDLHNTDTLKTVANATEFSFDAMKAYTNAKFQPIINEKPSYGELPPAIRVSK